MIYFSGVPSEEIEMYWDEVAPMLQKALDKTDSAYCYDVSHLKKWIEDKEYQLWVAHEDGDIKAAFMSCINIYPKCKILHIPFVGGEDIDKWLLQAWETFKEFGKANKCLCIRGYGRDGWTRVIKDKKTKHVLWDAPI